MNRFLRNAYKEVKTTLIGLVLIGVGVYVALQADVTEQLKETLAVSLVGAGLTFLGLKDKILTLLTRRGGQNGGS